jgi:hypothetical protein
MLVVALMLAACGSSAADSGGGSMPAATSSRSTPAATSSRSTAAASPARCGPAGARTLAASAVARVYVQGGAVYGCSDRTGRTTRLGQSRSCIATSRAGPAAVAGELAGYGLQTCGVDTGTAEVVVRRLSDGAVLRTQNATAGRRGPESYQSVGAIVVKSDGAVAWVGSAASIISHRAQLEVLAGDARGRTRVLDSGGAITPASLRLRGARLSWTDGGRTRSATLR